MPVLSKASPRPDFLWCWRAGCGILRPSGRNEFARRTEFKDVKKFYLTLASALCFCALAPWTGGEPASPTNSPARHKVQITDLRLAPQVTRAGARLIADYGSYQLYDAPADLPSLPAESAELRDEYNLIHLNAGELDTTASDVKAMSKTIGPFSGKRMHLVQFAGPVRPQWRKELLDAGVEIITYIPNNAYLVYGEAADLARVQGWAASAPHVQWEGAYQDEFRIHPMARPETARSDQFAIQLVADAAANAKTLQLIDQLKLAPVSRNRHVLNYVNLVVHLTPADVTKIAAMPDVVSIQPYETPRKFDERQDQIAAGNLSGSAPSGPGYLAWLASKGFTQAQFTASGLVVDVSDSGIDNGTTSPNHFGLYAEGIMGGGNSRVVYTRLEGTPNPGSTLEGCDGHGNINAHIVGGYDNSNNPGSRLVFEDKDGYHYGLGACPFVSLGSSVIFDPTNWTEPSFENLLSQAYENGVRISNNSWGDQDDGDCPAVTGGAYNIDSQEYDALVRDSQPGGALYPAAGNQEMTIVFAAGNNGQCGAKSVSAPATGKNVIAVGAADSVQLFGGSNGGADLGGVTDGMAKSANDIVNFSGRGPCADGRKKPDLVAPGTHISGGAPQSSDPGATGAGLDCFLANTEYTVGVDGGPNGSFFFPVDGQQFYTASSGTSHSTPCVAGGCALVWQYFLNQNLPAPSPAMAKAWLMNSARYLDGSLAKDSLWSATQGMGEMNLGTAFDGTPRILRDEDTGDLFTASGQSRSFAGAVADAAKPFRVTLAWTDAPGNTIGAAYNNDLDLTVAVGGKTYKGNVFAGANSTTGGSADIRDNVESVFLPAGASGKFTVTVTATSINSLAVPGAAGVVNQDFALVVYNAGQTPVLASGGAQLMTESCQPTNGVADPGETVTMNLTLQNAGTAGTTNLMATLLAGSTVSSPSGAQSYGVISPGGSAAMPFSFTASGNCGETATAALQLQDGSASLGTVTYNFPLGQLVIATNFAENFDEATAPSLPDGWGTSDLHSRASWTTEAGIDFSAPNAVYCPDSDFADIVYLTSPKIAMANGPSQLRFRQSFNLEDTYDGGILQISIAGQPFKEIEAAGGTFEQGSYVEALSQQGDSGCATELHDAKAWSGDSDGFESVVIHLPVAAEGKSVQFRWVCGTDCQNADLIGIGGWWIDDIAITQTNWNCCGSSALSGVPIPMITFPLVDFATNNPSITVTGTGVAKAAVSIYDGGTLVGKKTVGATGNFSIPIKLGIGAHALTALETSNGISSEATAPITVTMNLAPAITAQPQDILGFPKETVKFTASAAGFLPLHYDWQKNGVSVPGGSSSNLTLANLTSGSEGDYQLVVNNSYGSATSSVAALTLEANPFAGLAGTYCGLFAETSAQFDSSGFLKLTLTSLGTFSGTILNAGAMYNFSGAFSTAGQAQLTLKSLSATLNLDLTGASNQITGTVSGSTWTASLQADLAVFSKASPAPEAGKFTFALSNSSDGAASPGGEGFGTLTVASTGLISMSGNLADNTSVTPAGASVSKYGQWPLYIPLYGKLGSLSGWVNFGTTSSFAGQASWFRVGPDGKLYKSGFTNSVDVLGSSFVAGKAGNPVLAATNYTLTLSGGGLAADRTVGLTLTSAGKFLTNTGNDLKLTLSLSPSTGVLTGSFVDPQTHVKVAIKGVILQQQNSAAGFFVSTNATGTVLIQ